MGRGGESPDTGDRALVQEDTRFAPFLADQFDVAQFTSRVLAGSHTTAQAQSEQLSEGVRILESELATGRFRTASPHVGSVKILYAHRAEVTSRSGELIANVRRMGHAESSLQDVVLSVGTLQSAVHRIRGETSMGIQISERRNGGPDADLSYRGMGPLRSQCTFMRVRDLFYPTGTHA
jgi:hypothetical protein